MRIKRKAISVFLIVCTLIMTVFSLSACSKKPMLVPNVMGINHDEAKKVLESAGFEVLEIEADASSILPNSYADRSVKKGEVFKVNDEIYPTYSDNERYPMAPNGKVTIYYAVADYIFEEIDADIDTSESVTGDEALATQTPDNTTPITTIEWKQFLKEYEEWMDSYIALLKRYKENPSDTSILSDYIDAMQKITEWSEKAEQVEIDLANDPVAQKEYIQTLSRILLKLSEA